MTTTAYYSTAGGQGCTTAALLDALDRTRTDPTAPLEVTIAAHDVDALRDVGGFGPTWATRDTYPLTLAALDDDGADVFDVGPRDPGTVTADRYVMVLRGPAYPPLAAMTRRADVRPDAVLLLREPGRALDAGDVAEVVGVAPVVVDVDAAIARAVDAGLLAAGRVFGPLVRAIREVSGR